MRLEEAIQHCKDIVLENKECIGCIQEHRQLFEWLVELQEYRMEKDKEVCEMTDTLGY